MQLSDDALIRLHGEPGVLPDRKRNHPGFVDVCPSTWWAWVKQGIAPQPVRRGGATFWRGSDIKRFVRGEQ